MSPSTVVREEVLDIIYTALTEPNDPENRFRHQLVDTAKDGYFSLNLLKGLVVKLAPYPLTYLRHCIKQDQLCQPHGSRFELSADDNKVRRARSSTSETDAYGFLVNKSSTLDNKRQRTENIDDGLPSKKQQRGTYFTPYQPAFNYEALDEADNSVDLLPVIFDNGKFYQDESFFRSTSDDPANTVPSYNKLNLIPVGSKETYSTICAPLIEKACWNCDTPGHETRTCPEPLNRERIAVNRAVFMLEKAPVKMERYYKRLERLANADSISGLEPGRLSPNLREALGLLNDQDEPPYYQAMRANGYPPGYTGTYADQEHVMKLVLGNPVSETIPDLKIFSNHDDYSTQDLDDIQKEQDGSAKGQEERIRMVTYPGLYPPQMALDDIGRTEEQLAYHHPQHMHSQQNQMYQQQSIAHHQPMIQSYCNEQMYISDQQLYNQYISYYYNEQWAYYQSADPHQFYNEHHPIQYQHNLHNQPDDLPSLTHQDARIPRPRPPISTEDDIPPPPPTAGTGDDTPPPPPISTEVDTPPPPPPPISTEDDTPPPPPPPISTEDDTPPPPPPPISTEDDITPPPPPISTESSIPTSPPPPPPPL